VKAAVRRVERLGAMVLMSTWLFNGFVGRFHASPRPWTTWHAPLLGAFFHRRHKVLSQHGPSAISKRGMTEDEARAYRHVFDEPDSDHVVLTWPRTIPMREGDRGWADMAAIERRLPELAGVPTVLFYATEDSVFGLPYAERLKELLPNAEGPIAFDRADHFMQDDRGPDIARAIVEFLDRTVTARIGGESAEIAQRRDEALAGASEEAGL
jgi:pimeloyl-ACP methyl ester carboxylesterase